MKPFIVVQGPVATRSGYGNHTRDLVTALIKADKYDIQLISLPWGSCPTDALKKDNIDHQAIQQCITSGPINRQPDVFIQVSVPNEFQPYGKYNIGITAGIETTQVSHEFLEGMNRMDVNIVTSEHSKDGFINTVYDKVDEKTKQKQGELRLNKPIEVLFEGLDLNVYKKTTKIHDTVLNELSDIKEDFCYLFTGHWLKGDIGQDRKDIGMMIKTMCESFKNKSHKNRPGLVLKTSHASFSIIDRDNMMKRIQQIIEPYGNKALNIYLLHGDLTDDEMNSLYNHPKMKAMVSFTKGEGFGRPLLEFGITGKPIIASDWSGHKDFLKYATLLPGELTQVHNSAADKFILRDAKWFTVNYSYASKVLQDVIDDYKKYLEMSRKQSHYVKTNFNLDLMSEKFCGIVDAGVETIPTQMSLKLPKLKKVTSTEPPKIKLPKLKKVES
jgi:glycosyltransferase involved in cell wall biosynthesis